MKGRMAAISHESDLYQRLNGQARIEHYTEQIMAYHSVTDLEKC